jgi:hypothetical protein
MDRILDRKLETHLIACLDQLGEGKPVGEILAAYPAEKAAQLQPMLVTARQIRQLPLTYTLAAQARSEKRFLAEAARLRSSTTRPYPAWLPDLSGLWGGLRLATAVGLLLIFLFGGYILLQAPNSLPGDTMYGAKLALEEWRLAFSPDADALQAEFEAERRREVVRLLAADRSAPVTFSGQLAGSDAEFWLVSDIPVIITTDTLIVGELAMGAEVRVSGQTGDGRVWAEEIVVFRLEETVPVPPTPTTTPAPSLTPGPTATPSATPSATPLATTDGATPTATITPALLASPTATPTNTAVPVVPTATTMSDDNDNTNDNTNSNQNDNSSANDNNDNDNNSNDNVDDDDD